MSRIALLLGLLLATACERDSLTVPRAAPATQPSAQPVGSAGPRPAKPDTPVANPADIVGQWRVAGVGDRAVSQPFGIDAAIDPRRIVMTSGCIIFEWRYRLDRGAVELTGDSTQSVCERMYTPDEQALKAAMTGATRVYRLPSRALVFDGGAGTVTLFSQ